MYTYDVDPADCLRIYENKETGEIYFPKEVTIIFYTSKNSVFKGGYEVIEPVNFDKTRYEDAIISIASEIKRKRAITKHDKIRVVNS